MRSMSGGSFMIETMLLPLPGVDATSPVGVAIWVSERADNRIAQDLILNAAVAWPTYFKRAQHERPTRTVVHVAAPSGKIAN